MRSPYNAVTDTMNELGMDDSVRDTIRQDDNNHRIWHIRFESVPTALIRSILEIEVVQEEDGDASVCVIRRFNVGRRVMNRIMNCLVENLDDSPRLEEPLEPEHDRA
jgi:hypothetical protein